MTQTKSKPETFLREQLVRLIEPEPHESIEIEWNADCDGRPLVSEISLVQHGPDGQVAGGCSWMRGDPDLAIYTFCCAAADVLFAADIEPYRPNGWESLLDERAEAVERLERAWVALRGT